MHISGPKTDSSFVMFHKKKKKHIINPSQSLHKPIESCRSICPNPWSHLEAVWSAKVKDVLQNTWFRIAGSGGFVASARGSRPGDPLADLLFGVVMAGALRDLQGQFAAESLCPLVSTVGLLPGVQAETREIAAVGAWQDDAVFFVNAPTSHDLPEA